MRQWLSGALLVMMLLSMSMGVGAQDAKEPVTLTLAAYAVPREAYGKVIPLFQAYWQETQNQQVFFQESYLASGAQSRAVAGGFEADIVALSLEQHVTRLVDAGLITSDWQANGYNGMVSTSVALFVVRPGNPKGIQDWADLVKPGVEVITPDPATSGGAQWNVMAGYGAAFRGNVPGYTADADGALAFITDLFTNVSVMDADGRESFLTFERGIGDAAITYENEYYAGLSAGGEFEVVYPSSTILIENPIALVDTYVDAHGNREVAEAFLEFVYTPEAQAVFAESGFRPPVVVTDDTATAEAPIATEEAAATEEVADDRFPAIDDLFTIAEFGGWAEVVPAIFGEEGVFTGMIAEVKGQ
ncbi:MAG: sulfate ABC transporter substrate-binding protein [Armatimonadetes bacterium]|nr:sulfate ABC transporter substrate-binding protein [Anaerolineae bacterium]